MSNGLIFTQRFDLSQVTSRFADKNAAHFIGGGFKSFWVSSASSPDFSARMIFEPHTGSDSGTGLKLGLNMALTLSQVFSTACIEVDLVQPNQWIEITFSASESLSVGSVSVDLKLPSSPAELKVGPVTAPDDGNHFVVSFDCGISSNGHLIDSGVYFNPGSSIPRGRIYPSPYSFGKGVITGPGTVASCSTYKVPAGFRLKVLSWEAINNGTITATTSAAPLSFVFCAGVDGTNIGSNSFCNIDHYGVAAKDKSDSVSFFNPNIKDYADQGEVIGIYKGANNITAIGSTGVNIKVLVKLERI